MTQTHSHTKVRMARGKFDGINAVADERGVIAAMAIDQRGSLKKAIASSSFANTR
jgi:tagatose 1,6-diphosphate aldolase